MGLLIVLLLTVCIFLYKLTKIQLNKISTYEEWLISIKRNTNFVYKKIKELDDQGMFQKDDHVGFIFEELLNLIKWLDDRIIDV